MPKYDYLLNEINKVALILAKLMGLKAEGKHEEYLKQFDAGLQSEYNIELEKLLGFDTDEFTAHLNASAYTAEKLNALSQMLYVFAEPFNTDAETGLTLQKVLILFDFLEQTHHFQSFENISKRNTIYKYFNKIHEQP